MAVRGREAAAILEGRLGHAAQLGTEGALLSVPAGTAEAASRALAALLAAGIKPSDFSLGQPSLDEMFFALTARPDAENDRKGAP